MKSLVDQMMTVIRTQAYERGHSAGEEEVAGIERGLKDDWREVMDKVRMLENGTTFSVPICDIEAALEAEDSVTDSTRTLYMECMNGKSMRDRVVAIRDGCILTNLYLRHKP